MCMCACLLVCVLCVGDYKEVMEYVVNLCVIDQNMQDVIYLSIYKLSKKRNVLSLSTIFSKLNV